MQHPLCEGPGERDRKLLSGEDDVFSWCALAGWEAHTEVVTAKQPTIIAFSHDFGANRFPTDLSKSISVKSKFGLPKISFAFLENKLSPLSIKLNPNRIFGTGTKFCTNKFVLSV